MYRIKIVSMYPLCTRTAAADMAHRAYSRAAGHFLKCEGYIFKSQGPQLTGRPIPTACMSYRPQRSYRPERAAAAACRPAYIPARPASPDGRREGVSPCTRNIWPMTSRIGRALPGFRNIIQIWQPYRYDVLRLPEKSFHVLLIKSMYVSPAVSCFYWCNHNMHILAGTICNFKKLKVNQIWQPYHHDIGRLKKKSHLLLQSLSNKFLRWVRF